MMLLSIDELHAGYGEVEVLHGVSLNVAQGEIVALIGANGAGKTTLLKAISGLVRAQKGAIRFQGTAIERMAAHRIAAKGIIHCAEGRALLTRMSVYENLQMGAYMRSDKDVSADIEAMLERFPLLRERARQPASVLSGGEQQMLAIARALMARPRLLLLDEPSLGLAPKFVVEILRIVRSLHQDGITLLLVEQNARSALQLADRGYVLERGRIALEGKGDELLNNPDIQSMYLGTRSVAKGAVPAAII